MRSSPPRPIQAINIGQTAFSYAVRRGPSSRVSDAHGAPTWSRTHGPEPIHHQVAQVVHQAAPPPPPPGFVAPAAFVVNPRHYDIQPRKFYEPQL